MSEVSVPVDKEGFLLRLADWTPEVARELAAADDVALTEAHWAVIRIARDHYERYHLSPTARVLVKLVGRELGADKGRSIYLMQLFGGRPSRLANKIAGLPKPSDCA